MNTVKLSPKYQIVIPKKIRESMNFEPGQIFQVLGFNDRIELIKVQPMEESRGFLKEEAAAFKREEEDRY